MKKFIPVLAAFVLGCSLTSGLAYAEFQPHMKEAIRLLREARGQLDKVDVDKGGHRVAAIAKVDEAIAEVQAGIDHANDH
jgi:hypothetical protein